MQGIIDYEDTQQPHIMTGPDSENAGGLETTADTSDLSPFDVFFQDSKYSREDALLVLTAIMVLLLAIDLYDRRNA
ncbi:hypothetical protein [Haladaptatus sp. DYF46]|uniref:hypothetical protein n=1 Tax=Haladaptatus sp. DYF46 TaxID=2886041 RepID=UPI001E2C1AE7|nr:hypothetical protein [Haladaptatus sp. DYF46]